MEMSGYIGKIEIFKTFNGPDIGSVESEEDKRKNTRGTCENESRSMASETSTSTDTITGSMEKKPTLKKGASFNSYIVKLQDIPHLPSFDSTFTLLKNSKENQPILGKTLGDGIEKRAVSIDTGEEKCPIVQKILKRDSLEQKERGRRDSDTTSKVKALFKKVVSFITPFSSCSTVKEQVTKCEHFSHKQLVMLLPTNGVLWAKTKEVEDHLDMAQNVRKELNQEVEGLVKLYPELKEKDLFKVSQVKQILSGIDQSKQPEKHKKIRDYLRSLQAVRHLQIPAPYLLSKELFLKEKKETDHEENKVFDFCQTLKSDTAVFPIFVTERKEGSLQDMKSRLSVDQKIDVYLNVVEGLRFMNKKLGLQHRDNAPRNILVQVDPKTKKAEGFLTDFGATGPTKEPAKVKLMWETSPEALLDKEEHPSSDLFVVGLGLLQTLPKESGFGQLTHKQKMAAAKTAYKKGRLPIWIKAELEDLDEELQKRCSDKQRENAMKAIRGCLEIDPEKRISHEELSELLRKAIPNRNQN